jgi:hypothetical protein
MLSLIGLPFLFITRSPIMTASHHRHTCSDRSVSTCSTRGVGQEHAVTKAVPLSLVGVFHNWIPSRPSSMARGVVDDHCRQHHALGYQLCGTEVVVVEDEQKDVFAGSPTGANGGPPIYTMTIHAGSPTTITPNTIQRLRMLQNKKPKKRPKHSTDGVKELDTKVVLKKGNYSKCVFCKKPATTGVMWADGQAVRPVCNDHVDNAVEQVGGQSQVTAIKPIGDVHTGAEKKDAEQAKKTGGMVALIPDNASVKNLAVDHANADAPDELHLTLAYLGSDVTGMPAEQQDKLIDMARNYAQGTPPIRARAFAHCTFNPDGGADDDMDPCAAYLIGNEPDGGSKISDMAGDFRDMSPVKQHAPFVQHITAGYGMEAKHLKYAGAVRFDKVRVALAGKYHDFDLTGVETKKPDDRTVQKKTQERIDLLIFQADTRVDEVKTVLQALDVDVEAKGVLKREPGVHNWIDRLPTAMGAAFDASIVYRAAIHMNAEHGMDVGHAIASALNWAKYICDTGDVKQWPGIQNVKPPSRAEACAAIKLWQTMRAYAAAHKAGKDAGKASSKA